MYYQEQLNKKKEIFGFAKEEIMRQVSLEILTCVKSFEENTGKFGEEYHYSEKNVSAVENLLKSLENKLNLLSDLDKELSFFQDKADEELPFEVEK